MKSTQWVYILLFASSVCFSQYPDSIKLLYTDLDNFESTLELSRYYDDINELDSAYKYAMRTLQFKAVENTDASIGASNTLTKFFIINGDYNQAKVHNQRSIEQSRELNNNHLLANAYTYKGLINYYLGNYELTTADYKRSLDLYLGEDSQSDAATIYLNLGVLEKLKGNYGSAVEYYVQALKIHEELSDTAKIARVLSNIGNVYYYLEQDYNKALENFEKGLVMFKALHDSLNIANIQNSIGAVYTIFEQYDKASEQFFSSLAIFQRKNNLVGIASTYNHLGELYLETKEYNYALEYLEKAIELNKALEDAHNLIRQHKIIGRIHFELGNYVKAKEYYEQSLQEAESRSLKADIMEANQGLADVFEMQGQYKKALSYFKTYASYRDSVLNENNLQIVEDLNTKYETDKKEQELALEKTRNEVLELENRRGRAVILGAIIFLAVIISFSIVLFRQFSAKKKANYKLQISNRQIRDQHDKIFQQAKEIQDSINYARFIQEATMPPEELFSNVFDDYFIFYKPRDVVSGDFYWLYKYKQYVALVVADCTGHGVPGAFMSMLGLSAFRHVISGDISDLQTDVILNRVRDIIIEQLHQTGRLQEAKDGMDLSIAIIDQEKLSMQVSGAFNPVYHINKLKELTIYKADRMPIGISLKNEISFTKQDVKLEKGDLLYFFSDGYPDQFGGPLSKKFRIKPFRELLVKLQDLPMAEQKAQLDDTLANWMDGHEQIDDISIIGIKI